MDRYLHKPFKNQDSTQVQEVSPGSPEDKFRARLAATRLSDDPGFYALSYSWNAPKFDTSLECNDHILNITGNLAMVRTHLRDAMITLKIWIDQCASIKATLREVQLRFNSWAISTAAHAKFLSG